MNRQDAKALPGTNRFDALKPGALNRAEKDTVIKLALSVLADRHRAGRALSSPEQTRDFLRLKLVDRKHEVFGALFLDNRHRVIRVAEMFQGTIDGASVHPRVVAQRALELNAAAVVFFHFVPRNKMKIELSRVRGGGLDPAKRASGSVGAVDHKPSS